MNIRTIEVFDADTGLHEVITQSTYKPTPRVLLEAPRDYAEGEELYVVPTLLQYQAI